MTAMAGKATAQVHLQEDSTICLLANGCLKKFKRLFDVLNRQYTSIDAQVDLDSTRLVIEDAQARFRAWGTNIAAFREGKHRISLDYRLNEAPGIKRRTLQILGDLQEYLGDGKIHRVINTPQLNMF